MSLKETKIALWVLIPILTMTFAVDIQAQVFKSCDFQSPGDGCIFDVIAIGNGKLTVETKAFTEGDHWRVTIVEVGRKGAKSKLGIGSSSFFSGAVSIHVKGGTSYEVFVTYESETSSGIFPSNVQIQFSGPVDVQGPRGLIITEGVFVSPYGDDSWPGTQEAPVASIEEGISKAVQQNVDVVNVDMGLYALTDALVLANGVSIIGGFDSQNGWEWSLENESRIEVANYVAVIASNIQLPTFLQRLTIIGSDNPNPNGSSYGIMAMSSDGLVIRECTIRSGSGERGDNGMDEPGSGSDGGSGGNGQNGCENGDLFVCSTCSEPQAGDPGLSPSGIGEGGRGGRPGLGDETGQSGVSAPGGAQGGNGGSENQPGSHGQNGTAGASGSHGSAGNPLYTSNGYSPTNGSIGGDGQSGAGGGGGGGGGGGVNSTFCNHYGGAGGGGGAGGEVGGIGGNGASSGGGSFGIYLWDSDVLIELSEIWTLNGGYGGNGGAGQPSGSGGMGGSGGLGSDSGNSGLGGNGGNGGDGGPGGYGGNGAGGPTIGILIGGTSNPTMTTNIFSLGRPGNGGLSPGDPGPTGLSAETHTPSSGPLP